MFKSSASMVLASVLSGAGLAGAEEIAARWPEEYFNPRPALGDLLLPMPCGGAMAFRPVEVPSNGWLSDWPVELGQVDPQQGYKEGRRAAHIAGAFTDPANDQRRFYYLAKYEATQDQYAVVAASDCPEPSAEGRLPKTEVSWFEAVNFAARYSEWLLQNAPPQLPREERQPGFLRLPTEVEWEFAARGGLQVDKTAFVAPVFPTPAGGLNQYVWHQGTQSAAGKLQNVGLLEPNPLGFHDMLGNASEMVFVPFRLNRRGRPHGQSGGLVAKGGDIFTSRSRIRSAAREELPYFDPDTGKAKRLRTLGFRLALTAPVIVSHQRLRRLREEWSRLPELPGEAGANIRQAMDSLGAMIGQTSDPKMHADLELVQRNLEHAHTRLNETRDRAIKALIRMGAFLGNKVATDRVRLRGIETAIGVAAREFDNLENAVRSRPVKERKQLLDRAKGQLEKMEAKREAVQGSLQYSLSYYGDMVIEVARDYSLQLLEPQLAVMTVEFHDKKSRYLIDYANLFLSHVKVYQSSGTADTYQWLQEILKLRVDKAD
jgi:hypothetical protein